MSAPNVSDGAEPDSAGDVSLLPSEMLVTLTIEKAGCLAMYDTKEMFDRVRECRAELVKRLARHCPVGCAANEVGAGERVSHFAMVLASYVQHSTFEPIKGKPHPFTGKSHQEIARLLQANIDEPKATPAPARIRNLADLRQWAEPDGDNDTLAEVRLWVRDLLKAPPAPTAPVGDGALREALKPFAAVAVAYRQSGLDECRPEWGGEIKDASTEIVSGRGGKSLLQLHHFLHAEAVLHALTVPTGSVKEGDRE